MKWVILHTDTQVVYCQQLPDNTRPIYNVHLYTEHEFDTEAEMQQFVNDNHLEVIDETV